MATCARCGGSILWLRFADSGKPIAINVYQSPTGNIDIEPDGAHVVTPDHKTLRHVPHFATCAPYVAEKQAARKSAKKAEARKQLDLFGGRFGGVGARANGGRR